MNAFTKLAQANVDHYNAHPVRHIAIGVVYTVVALKVINKMVKKIAGVEEDRP